MNDKDLYELLQRGYILLQKNGIIESIKAPPFGEVSIQYVNDKAEIIKRTETIK